VRLTRLLVQNGFLVLDDADETAVLENIHRRSREDEATLSLTILPTLACNFRCTYCYEGAPDARHMGRDVEEALVAFTRDRLRRGGRLSVTWFGGEPLLNKSAIDTLSMAFHSLCEERGAGYDAGIITNGYHLDKETATWLAGLKVKTAQVTLDGPPDIHDRRRPLASGGPTFGTIINNLKAAADILEITVRVNVDDTNSDSMGRFLDLMVEEGVADKVGFYPGHTTAYTSTCGNVAGQCLGGEEFSLVSLEMSLALTERGLPDGSLPSARNLPCGAVRRENFVITPSGGIAVCWNHVAAPEKFVGHLIEPPTEDMERNKRRWSAFDPFALECGDCQVLPICMGACPDVYFEKNRLACLGWKHHPDEHLLNYYRLRTLQQQAEMSREFQVIVAALKKKKSSSS